MNWFERAVRATTQSHTALTKRRDSTQSVDAPQSSLAMQAPRLGNHNLERLLRARLIQAAATPTNHVVQRKPRTAKDDPNQTVHSVDATGKIVPGATQADQSEAVWRIPIHGLRNDPTSWAVVLMPNLLLPTASDAHVDVLLHFHGFGAGYQMLEPGQLRDVDLYQAEQQLLSLAKVRGKFVMAILPQGSDHSKFGDLPEHSDSFIREVFARLITAGHLPTRASPGNVIVSGHSGGGVPAMSAATERVSKGGRQDLLLFDAINFGCPDSEKVQLVRNGEKQYKKNGSPVMVCKTCGSNEYRTVSAWVTERIKQDVRDHLTSENLKKFGTRFRGFTHDAVDPRRDTCSYGHWYGQLKADIDKSIADLHLSAEVAAQLHENFQVKQVPGAHEDVMGHGSLEATLGG